MKKNVLVFPCGSEIGLEIHRSLCSSTHFTLHGGSSVDDHGRFVYENYINNIPHIDDKKFINELNGIIDKYKIDFIFPAHDSVVLRLAQSEADGQLNCKVITSPVETCEIARSKLQTYELFEGIIPTPGVYRDVKQIEDNLPVFLKPDVGQGSKGVYLAKNMRDVEFYIEKDPTLLALEYLPGKEYTIDCFTDLNGELLVSEGRGRNRISNGISVASKGVEDSRFIDIAKKINATLKFRGVWFFQVKESSEGELVLMEIAPRIAGTMGLMRARGVNLCILSLFDAMGIATSIFENDYKIEIDRALHNVFIHDMAYEHVYLDFDDLVIVRGKVNPLVMSFVYQCINKSIRIHLITKHTKELTNALREHRLEGVFDSLIWIKQKDEKHTYIKEKNSIFIDDSFQERKKVHEKHNIPVFDGHMIEALIEKF